MSTFSKVRSKDYLKKKNMLQNNWTAEKRSTRSRLASGDGVLPKSTKYRTWSCRKDCAKKHEHREKVAKSTLY